MKKVTQIEADYPATTGIGGQNGVNHETVSVGFCFECPVYQQLDTSLTYAFAIRGWALLLKDTQ
jgi:hypothetical protein